MEGEFYLPYNTRFVNDVWDQSRKGNCINLSNGNLTAKIGGGNGFGGQNVRGKYEFGMNKDGCKRFYTEMKYKCNDAGNFLIGLVPSKDTEYDTLQHTLQESFSFCPYNGSLFRLPESKIPNYGKVIEKAVDSIGIYIDFEIG